MEHDVEKGKAVIYEKEVETIESQPCTPTTSHAFERIDSEVNHYSATQQLIDRRRKREEPEAAKLFKTFCPPGSVARHVTFIIPMAVILAMPLCIFATVKKDVYIGNDQYKYEMYAFFVWIEMLWLSIWIARMIASTFPYIYKVIAGLFTSQIRLGALLLGKLVFPISITMTLVCAFVTQPLISIFNEPHRWTWHFDHTAEHTDWMHDLQRVIVATVAVSSVYLAEKIIVQLLSVTHHRKSEETVLNDMRIMRNLIAKLYAQSLKNFPKTLEVYGLCHRLQELDIIIDVDYGATKALIDHNKPDGRVKAWIRWSLKGIWLRQHFLLRKWLMLLADPSKDQKAEGIDGVDQTILAALEHKKLAAAIAERIWYSLSRSGSERVKIEITSDEFEAAFGNAEEKYEAKLFFKFLDKDGNGTLNWGEMSQKFIEVERNQKNIDKTTVQIENALQSLDRILLVAVLIAAALIYAAFFSDNFFTHFTIMTTTVMSFSFAFAGTVQEFTSSCIFLFLKQPYDIGDRVTVNDIDMLVRHISLLYTQFRRVDNNKIVQIPNTMLNASWIENLTRSGIIKEFVPLIVDPGTDMEDIQLLQQWLNEFVNEGDNSRHFQENVYVDIIGINDFKTLSLQIEYGQKRDWSTDTLRFLRRNKFMATVVDCMRQIPIHGPGGAVPAVGSEHAPSYSVSVNAIEAKAANDKYLEDLKVKKSSAIRQRTQRAANLEPEKSSMEQQPPIPHWSERKPIAPRNSIDEKRAVKKRYIL